eukprot:EC096208.1.p3 GENE.EC096208.1~~EC096208.1.p3  ORF type:complete len:148 (-),score=8.56 EC096208.1:66-509(-)
MACPGGILINLGNSPFHIAAMPSFYGMLIIASKNPLYYVVDYPLRQAISRVLHTSNGFVTHGPKQAAEKPEIMDYHGRNYFPSPSCLFQYNLSILCFAQNRHIQFVPLRRTVGAAPDHIASTPSSRIIVEAQCMGFLYFNQFFARPF